MIMRKENLEDKVLNILKERELSIPELISILDDEGIYMNPVELRKLISKLLKEGKLIKFPSRLETRFKFKAKE
ncbi:MAG TPA: hypothetical protein ENF75_06935 [Acidilobales archaeon]|nr:MAG: hypothetical protein B6U85_08530 [Desulfurococcales archaeon ex4484_42]HDD26799.1 hypothetical protein [Acidilobales archaeon]